MSILMKTIFITGSSRGIGLEMAKQSLAAGDHVLASCRKPQDAVELKELLNRYDRLDILKMDVNSKSSVDHCFGELHAQKQPIDLLFNNAGIIDWSNIHEVSEVSFEKIYQTNVIGAFNSLRGSIPCLRLSSNPIVVNLSSRLGSIGLRGETQLGGAISYQCSKSALNMLTRQAALDLKALGICVISLSPGWVKTDMGGDKAKYDVKESVRLLSSTIEKVSLKDSGTFIGEDGLPIPW